MGDQTETTSIPPAPPPIKVRIESGTADKSEYSFTQPFRCGRDKSCEVRLTDTAVSRFHAEFWFSDGKWWILDLQSANGSCVDGRRVERAPIATLVRVQLGDDGPILLLTLESVSTVEGVNEDEKIQVGPPSLEHYQEHYFQDTEKGKIGEHTMMIRQAFKKVQKRQRGRFVAAIAVLSCLVLVAGIYALYKHQELRKQKLLAEDIFYTMKSMELEFAPIVKMARLSRDAHLIARVKQYQTRRKLMENKYDKFIEALEIYKKNIGPEERMILRIARIFGECDIKMPADFVQEVQYFYLALQESNFNLEAIGPETKWGIAKGMWQFIPATAVFYGLRTGPLQHLRRPDPRDERHNFEKSTKAAAKYIKTIYDSEAQASGLLVMASYNWGERRVNRLIKTMPENPQERNFWLLLEKYKKRIPRQTYDYVVHIFSAAVIGENPNLFGFDFENPLAYLQPQS